ncbi:threonine aldolase [Exidia glandulosa HHB12029]|uniref:Threonine aldolase n=1 Tax=Exidia glandulosa HHB12029 TaxID=1314781 RepID=A0A165PDQ4_EXIGL|nr:threonine aldolase [Exidia glandulosa HHB12029]
MEAARAKVAQEVRFDINASNQAEVNAKAYRAIARSFVSDTVTVPTPEMYQYAMLGSLGDDVFHEPHTQALEAHLAKITGKEAALYVSSGTQSNQLALRAHLTQPPHSVLMDIRAHVNVHEGGGLAYHCGAATVAITPTNGHHITLDEVKKHIILDNQLGHAAVTRVIELENTLNGTIFPQDEIVAISDFAHSKGVLMHLDGARLWHVAAETGKSLTELCAPFDSVNMCFSKGLGAPIGSILAGPKDFIARARVLRKLFGGGMRQTGFLAAAAAYALTNNFPRLPAVHKLAQKLEAGLEALGVTITSRAETCMVFFSCEGLGFDASEVVKRAEALPDPITLFGERLVVHIQTSEEAVDDLLALFKALIEEKRAAGLANGVATNGSATSASPYVKA